MARCLSCSMLGTGDDGNSAAAIASPKRAGDGASPEARPLPEILPEPLPEPGPNRSVPQ
jgi:hypothetical protein